MKTKETWLRVQKHHLAKFTPRLQEEIVKYPVEEGTTVESLFIYGPCGSGKTILAAAMLFEKLRQDYFTNNEITVRFCTVETTFDTLRKEINQTPDTSFFDDLMNCDLLVLDDLGTDKPTDWVLTTLYRLINHRYEYKKDTIITSNKSLKELAELFGDDRITSRIERMCKIVKKKKV